MKIIISICETECEPTVDSIENHQLSKENRMNNVIQFPASPSWTFADKDCWYKHPEYTSPTDQQKSNPVDEKLTETLSNLRSIKKMASFDELDRDDLDAIWRFADRVQIDIEDALGNPSLRKAA